MVIHYRPQGVCSRRMIVDVEDGVIRSVQVLGGCDGNLKGIRNLLKGMKAEEAIARLEAQMGDPEIYKDGQKAAQVAREHEQMQQKLDALYEEWEELTNAAESFES